MRGRFYGLVGCLYQATNAAARVASAANSPLPNATGGQKGLDGRGAFRCGHFLRSILALAETRGRTRGNFRAPDARRNSRADHGRPDPRRCRAVVSRRSARSQLTRQPSDGGRDFRFTPNNGHETCQPNWSAKCHERTCAPQRAIAQSACR
jgi:hypothetical protein